VFLEVTAMAFCVLYVTMRALAASFGCPLHVCMCVCVCVCVCVQCVQYIAVWCSVVQRGAGTHMAHTHGRAPRRYACLARVRVCVWCERVTQCLREV